MRLLVVLVAIGLAYLGFRWLARQPKRTRFQVAAVVLGVALIALAATGRLNWVFALIGAMLPFLRRVLALFAYLPALQRLYSQFSPASGQPSTGQQSAVQTRFLRMTLDHDTGNMDGSVLEGRFTGTALGTMNFEQLLELLAECVQQDEESAELLRAYLGKVHAARWEQQEGYQATGENGGGGFSSSMTQQEACEILGLEQGADDKAIREAHRRLMQKLHPDHGGSTFLAAKVNQAKDLLLRRG